MYKGKYDGKHRKAKAQPVRRKTYHKGRLTAMVIATAVLLALAIGGTVAWLSTKDAPITNTFKPSHVSCSVTEEFDGKIKSNVNVTNTSDIDAYIRVKLVTYRVNELNQHIGGTATIPTFEPGAGWVKSGDYYYYTLPVAANRTTANLINSIELTGSYNDADGGKQAIEVMAEAIQSQPAEAVGSSWGVSISVGSVTAYKNN